jgi:glucose/arabinose dehydrogenase
MYKKEKQFIFILSFLLVFFLWFLSYDDYLYGSSSSVVSQNQSVDIKDKALAAEIVFRGIEFPTSMAFLNNDDILVLEKNNGTVRRITEGKMAHDPVTDLDVASRGERGLLGIATLTTNSTNNNKTLVFLYLTESSGKDGDDHYKNNPIGNRIYKFEFSEDASKLVNKKLLIDLPVGQAAHHNGGKIVIGPDRNLYFTIGDLGSDNFQITNNKIGSKPDGRAGILRITPDGGAVEDDFSLGKRHPLNKYFAYGIRNSFGMDFDPVSGKLWDIENGPGFGDEINLVEPGFNSGWSKIQSFWENTTSSTPRYVGDNPKDLFSFDGKGKYSPPELSFLNKMGLSAMQFFDSNELGKKYKDTLFVGDFHSGKLYNFRLSENRTSIILDKNGTNDKMAENELQLEPFEFAEGFGGIVDVQTGPDGYLYVLSLQYGGYDCYDSKVNCIDYSSKNIGSIFRVIPK